LNLEMYALNSCDFYNEVPTISNLKLAGKRLLSIEFSVVLERGKTGGTDVPTTRKSGVCPSRILANFFMISRRIWVNNKVQNLWYKNRNCLPLFPT